MKKSKISDIKRPRILVKAAQIGAANYNRDLNLRRVLGCNRLPKPQDAIERLSDKENALNADRLSGEASYSIQRHISVLAALLGEVRFLSP